MHYLAIPVVLAMMHPIEESPSDKGHKLLTREEARFLRNHVDTKAAIIGHEGRWEGDRLILSPTGVVPVPSGVSQIHKAKRVATLRLLRGIVKNGSRRDVVHAITVAVALEEGPAYAAPYVFISTNTIDSHLAGLSETRRDGFVKQIEGYLDKAQKREQK